MPVRDDNMSKVDIARRTPEYIACLDELLGAVDPDEDGEYNVLRQLVHRAGAGWICANNHCRGINNLVDNRCCGCDSKRPTARSRPQPEDLTRCSIEYRRNEKRKQALQNDSLLTYSNEPQAAEG